MSPLPPITIKLDREQSANTGKAIAAFAAALGGGTTIRLGSTTTAAAA